MGCRATYYILTTGTGTLGDSLSLSPAPGIAGLRDFTKWEANHATLLCLCTDLLVHIMSLCSGRS